MRNANKKKYIKYLMVLSIFLCSASLYGCGDGNRNNEETLINAHDYTLTYFGNTKLEKILVQNDDMNEITDLYQEIGVENNGFKDSLLIAEVFAQGRGVNTFAQDNLDTLEIQGLSLDDVNKQQIGVKKNGKTINCVLVEYSIIAGFIAEVPVLYVSQLFVPDEGNIILYSFITEDEKNHKNASNMLKNIK